MSKAEAFQFLGFGPGTYSKRDITDRYRQMAMRLHPDRGGTTEKFQELQEAYEIAIGQRPARGEYQGSSGYGSAWDDFFRDVFRSRARREGGYYYQGSSERSHKSYKAGAGCGKGNHSWVDKGTYHKCSRCGASKTKTRYARSSSDYRDRVGRM